MTTTHKLKQSLGALSWLKVGGFAKFAGLIAFIFDFGKNLFHNIFGLKHPLPIYDFEAESSIDNFAKS